MKKFVLVIATQRSGSTMVCNDLYSLGGLGRPGEHLLPIFKRAEAERTDQAVLDLILKDGRENESSDSYGVKLMANYAPQICAAVRPDARHDTPSFDALRGFVDWAETQFDRTAVVILFRDSIFEQALSYTKAMQTGVYHKFDDLVSIGGQTRAFADDAEFYAQLMEFCAKFQRERGVLERLAADLGERCVVLKYEQVALSPNYFYPKAFPYLEERGFALRRKLVRRTSLKLVSREETAAHRAAFERYLQEQILA